LFDSPPSNGTPISGGGIIPSQSPSPTGLSTASTAVFEWLDGGPSSQEEQAVATDSSGGGGDGGTSANGYFLRGHPYFDQSHGATISSVNGHAQQHQHQQLASIYGATSPYYQVGDNLL
jgi:hypothetical protein